MVNLGQVTGFPNGMFVVQDGNNSDNGEHVPQNFKMVGWEKIAVPFDPPLFIDTAFNVRNLFEDRYFYSSTITEKRLILELSYDQATR